MIRPIANTSATPTTAITKRFHRHCRSRSAALSTAIRYGSTGYSGQVARYGSSDGMYCCHSALVMFRPATVQAFSRHDAGSMSHIVSAESNVDHGPAVGGEASRR